jgi:hypothetical protein
VAVVVGVVEVDEPGEVDELDEQAAGTVATRAAPASDDHHRTR